MTPRSNLAAGVLGDVTSLMEIGQVRCHPAELATSDLRQARSPGALGGLAGPTTSCTPPTSCSERLLIVGGGRGRVRPTCEGVVA